MTWNICQHITWLQKNKLKKLATLFFLNLCKRLQIQSAMKLSEPQQQQQQQKYKKKNFQKMEKAQTQQNYVIKKVVQIYKYWEVPYLTYLKKLDLWHILKITFPLKHLRWHKRSVFACLIWWSLRYGKSLTNEVYFK